MTLAFYEDISYFEWMDYLRREYGNLVADGWVPNEIKLIIMDTCLELDMDWCYMAEQVVAEHRELMKGIQRELRIFKGCGVPRCQNCKTQMRKLKSQSSKFHSTWEFDCKCQRRGLRLSIG